MGAAGGGASPTPSGYLGGYRRASPVPSVVGMTNTMTATATTPAITTATTDVMRIDRRFGTVLREGPWVVPERIEVRLALGDARLDFTEAVIGSDTLRLEVDLSIGSDLTLVVPPGVKVVIGDLVTGTGDIKVRTGPGDDTPVALRIEVCGRLRAGADLTVRGPRRNFDQWTRPSGAS